MRLEAAGNGAPAFEGRQAALASCPGTAESLGWTSTTLARRAQQIKNEDARDCRERRRDAI